MSDAETADPSEEGEQASEGAERAGERASAGDDQPTIDDGERADVDSELASLAADVEAEAGAGSDDEDDESDDQEGSGDLAKPTEEGSPNWGDLYVGTVTTGLNAVIDEYGDEDAEHIDESLARDLHLDEYVDEWMNQQGKAEMDPAQGMLIATAALAATVLISKTDLPSKALKKAKSDD
ncbi:hypothetical protein [Halobacterium wangiae]|uniref:hypothetical protein n=1 Tax=Halobacterium wangiae TaxID=2902623 RepID=UPI001E4CC4C0|nr:hypothetical protein [Halobacterium wangiae]